MYMYGYTCDSLPVELTVLMILTNNIKLLDTHWVLLKVLLVLPIW